MLASVDTSLPSINSKRQEIIAIARSWIPTRWQHQGTTKGLGADCEGFVEGVFREAGYVELGDLVHNWRRREDGSLMLNLLETNLDFVTDKEISLALPADILAFCDEHLRQPEVPRHLGIYTEQRGDGVHYVIHMGNETHGVVEHRMDARWLKRVHSIWRVRGVDDHYN